MSLLKKKIANDIDFNNLFDQKINDFLKLQNTKCKNNLLHFKDQTQSLINILQNTIGKYFNNNQIQNKIIGRNFKFSFFSKFNKQYSLIYITFKFSGSLESIENLKQFIEINLNKLFLINNIKCYVDNNELYFLFKNEI